MNNYTSYAFISVLLGLIMFFAYQSFAPKDKGIDIRRPANDGAIICIMDPCGIHYLSIEKSGLISFNSLYLSAEEFGSHLAKDHEGCELMSVSISAPADFDSGKVMEITNILKKDSENVSIAWLVK